MIDWLKDIIRNVRPSAISIRWDEEKRIFFYIDRIFNTADGRTFIYCREEVK